VLGAVYSTRPASIRLRDGAIAVMAAGRLRDERDYPIAVRQA